MSSTTPHEPLVRMSLSGLLVLIALIAMAIPSLMVATEAWLAIVMAVTLAAFLVAVVDAAVDRGSRRAFALGFAVCLTIYVYLVVSAPLGFDVQRRSSLRLSPEMELGSGRLSTTYVLRRLYGVVQDVRWVESSTGQEITGYNPDQPLSRSSPRRGAISAARLQSPQPDIFTAIGHCWWALLLGYAGGWVARFVYLRRIRERATLAVHSS